MTARRRTPDLTAGITGLLLRAAPGRALVLAVLVALAAGALVAVPAWLDRTTSAALPARLAERAPGQLGLEFSQGGRIEPGPDANPFGPVLAAGDAIAASLPGSVAAIAPTHTALVDSPEYLALSAPVQVTRFAMRVWPDASTLTRVVDGRAPTGTVTVEQIGDLLDQSGAPLVGPTFETAISRETATELGLKVGDRLGLMPGGNRYGIAIGMTITGIFEDAAPADPRWFSDATLRSPVEVRASAEVTIYHAVALLDPAAYGPLSKVGGGVNGPTLQYRWRFPADTSGAGAWDVARLASDLARLEAVYPFHGALAADAPGLSTGLPDVLAAYATDRAVAASAMALAATGPLVAGIGMLALAASVVADRRRVPLRLVRTRGAAVPRLLAADLVAAAALVVPAAVAGAAIAGLAARPAQPLEAVVIAAAAAALAGVLLSAWEATRTLRGPAAVRLAGAPRPLLRPARARVATVLIVLVAVMAAIALRTAAHTGPGAATGSSAVVVPVLLGLAGGVLLARLLGVAAGGAARLAARAPGLALVHALRGLSRGRAGLGLPMAVVVVAVASGILASSIAATVAQSQAVAAADAVGADFRVAAQSPGGLPTGLDPSSLAALGPVAVVGQASANLSSATLASAFSSVAAIDPDAYARVVDGTDVDAALMAALRAAAATGSATAAEPNLGLVLRATFAGRTGLAVGGHVTFTAGGKPVDATVAAVLPDLPGLAPTTDVAVTAAGLEAAVGDIAVPAVVLLRSSTDAAAVEDAVRAYRGQLDVRSREKALDALSSGPMPTALRDGFALMLAIASVLAGIVVAASLLAALGLRAREAAVLAALGVGGRTARLVIVSEAGMTVVLALAAGLALGLAIAVIAIPDLGVERMAGVARAVPPQVTAGGVAAAVAGPVLVGLAALLGTLLVAHTGESPARLLAEEA